MIPRKCHTLFPDLQVSKLGGTSGGSLCKRPREACLKRALRLPRSVSALAARLEDREHVLSFRYLWHAGYGELFRDEVQSARHHRGVEFGVGGIRHHGGIHLAAVCEDGHVG